MTFAALAFAAGVIALQWQPVLPPLAWAAVLLPLALLALKDRRFIVLAALAGGFFWAAACAQLRMTEWLAPELEGRDVEVVGTVSSLPAVSERSVRFEFEVESTTGGERLPRKLLLSWYRSALFDPEVHPGERWVFSVRLRRPHGLVNPQGFDYEAWLLERGIGATGYVRQRGQQKKLGWRNSLLDRIEQAREAVRERFFAHLGATPAAGILAALAVGDQRAIAAEEWQLFSRTGVTHLMSISGLHVTLVSGLVAWLAAFLWRGVPALALRLPARKAAALAAIAAALGYTLLAGFAVPAQRTFYMVTVVAAALWAGRMASPARTLGLALAVVLLADPWAPLAPGFWLSFGAVALIFYVATGWTEREGRLKQYGRIQWAITFGLAPAALLLFGQISLAGPLANAAAIPLVSAVITPLALGAALLPIPAVLDVAAWLVEWLLQFLEWCAALPGALWQQHVPPAWSVALGLAGVAWLLAPRGVPGRACGVALMAPAFFIAPAAPVRGEAWVTTYDVGQGLAVMVRTARRTLLYDAGPAFGPESDSGGRVVVPALRAAGLASVDLMILTHEDMDHIGGALTVLESVEVTSLSSSLPPAHALNTLVAGPRRCLAGAAWEWDGVRFELVHPPSTGERLRRNNQSCVLRIASGGGAMLLTGDIERLAELSLLDKNVKADVLLVPHHGSGTSSSREFIAAVAPRWAVVPAGYRSRFGHPSAEVLERYRSAGAAILRTDLDGAVLVRLGRDAVEASGERLREPRYWRRMPPV
ncbi:MAG: DNA internalization-related competence protein ComEC/Rec2 [Betaproteobacteria bacterium RIFCSPLOWO2_12_FULL_65_14]|nr:MAG: DNA internalization-related competence protein ComEC/Rec2 [Betaproteobacteria bacterium RIFCSPLOWO2_12_FULL_65_14]